MEALTSFTIFSKLPRDIRFMIRDTLPRPQRVIGMLPCPTCWETHYLDGVEREFVFNFYHLRHSDWYLRYSVQPFKELVPAPLHVCQESRSIWRGDYVAGSRSSPLSRPGRVVRCDAPDINYDTDIFTIFSTWTANLVIKVTTEHEIFPSMDTTRVQHIAISSHLIHKNRLSALRHLRYSDFSSLQRISLLNISPTETADNMLLPIPHMEVEELEFGMTCCERRDVAADLLQNASFCDRFDDPGIFDDPSGYLFDYTAERREATPARYLMLLKAWLWHEKRCDSVELEKFDSARFAGHSFLNYIMFGREQHCPLPFTTCGAEGHSREEMLCGPIELQLDCKVLADADLIDRVFDEELQWNEGRYNQWKA